MTTRRRRRFTADFKKRAALEALREKGCPKCPVVESDPPGQGVRTVSLTCASRAGARRAPRRRGPVGGVRVSSPREAARQGAMTVF